MHKGYIFVCLTKEMHGIPYAGIISYDDVIHHMLSYGYHPSNKTPGLCTHNSRPINFTLVVNGFGVNYSGKEHDLHLKAALEDK